MLTDAVNRKVGLIRSLALAQPPILSSWAVGSCSLFAWSAPCIDWTSPVELKPQLEDARSRIGVTPAAKLGVSADNIYLEENVWLSTFGDLKLLHDVSVKRHGGNSIVYALATSIPELIPATGQGFQTAPHLSFVGLQTLVCNEWQFDDKEHYGTPATKQLQIVYR
ncbi:hypothetical protein Hypma_002834 [Hypsizygus marmoreus]|uniref:Uncharacterized protein n=1 Tax=Hypsizygus marmoreus TaxID=39966 RepID=A0A369JAH4_HYPMA|nr:hypothetical protein Hypma_002834 [Hypsizygus marmoreus]